MGIAEQNMVATAAGMAACGKIPFVNTFTVSSPRWVCSRLATRYATQT